MSYYVILSVAKNLSPYPYKEILRYVSDDTMDSSPTLCHTP
jgi:hypothetical protein